MERRRRQPGWGVIPFVLALVTLGVILALRGLTSPGEVPRWLAVPALVAVVLLGYFNQLSFPRVPNAKVVVFGYGMATQVFVGVVVVLLFPQVADAALLLAYGITLGVLILVSVIPEAVRHRTIRLVRVLVVVGVAGSGVAALALPAVRFFLHGQLAALADPQSWVFLIFSTAALAVFALALFGVMDRGGISGMHAGTVLVLAMGWVLPRGDAAFHGVIHAVLPLYAAIATGLYWFRHLDNRGFYDPELRIYNRGRCDQIIREQFPLNPGAPLAVMMLAVELKDTTGVLPLLVQKLRELVMPAGILGRYDGTTVIVFLPGSTAGDARRVLRDLRRRIPNDRSFVLYTGIAGRESRNPSISRLVTAAHTELRSQRET